MSQKRLLTDVVFYGGMFLLQRAFNFLLIPIYTRALSQADYGILDLMLALVQMAFIGFNWQHVYAINRFYPKAKEEDRHRELIGTFIVTSVGVSSLGVALLLGMGHLGLLEADFLPSFSSYTTVWWVFLLSIPIHQAFEVLLVQAIVGRSKRLFMVGSLISTVFIGLMCVLFVVVFNMGILGVAVGQLVGRVVALVVQYAGLRREVRLTFRWAVLKPALKYTLPLVPGEWLIFSSVSVSHFFIMGHLGPEEVAVFAIASKALMMVSFINMSFQNAWQPLAMRAIGQQGSHLFYVQSLRMHVAGSLLGLFLITALASVITAVLAPPSYAAAARYLPLMAVAGILSGTAATLQLGNQITKKTIWMTAANFASLSVNLGFLILLTGRLSIWAAVAGAISGGLCQWLVARVSSHRNYPLPHRADTFVLLFMGLVLSVLLTMFVQPRAPLAIYAPATMLLGLTLAWRVFPRQERVVVIARVRQLLARRGSGD